MAATLVEAVHSHMPGDSLLSSPILTSLPQSPVSTVLLPAITLGLSPMSPCAARAGPPLLLPEHTASSGAVPG